MERFFDMLQHHRQDGGHVNGRGEIATEIIETFGLQFPVPQGFGPRPRPGHQGGDDHPNREQAKKGDGILGIGHGETPPRLDKKEIKGQYAKGRSENGLLQAETDSDQDHVQEIHHHQIGRRHVRRHGKREQGGGRDQGQARQGLRPTAAQGWKPWRRGASRGFLVETDHMDVDRAAETD